MCHRHLYASGLGPRSGGLGLGLARAPWLHSLHPRISECQVPIVSTNTRNLVHSGFRARARPQAASRKAQGRTHTQAGMRGRPPTRHPSAPRPPSHSHRDLV
jgi:hypothetical protein